MYSFVAGSDYKRADKCISFWFFQQISAALLELFTTRIPHNYTAIRPSRSMK